MPNAINPFPYFSEAGTGGYIYIGTANLDAQTNPITVYRDAGLTIPWAQPIRTVDGYPAYQGAPAAIYTSGSAFSITVKDANNNTRTSSLNVSTIVDAAALASASGAGLIGFNQSQAYAAGTVGNLLLNWADVCAAPYNADPTGVADSTAAFNAALATGRPVWVKQGTYRVSSLTALDRDGVVICGPGPDLARIIQTSTTADLFTIGAGSVLRYSPRIEGLSFTVASTKTAGYLVRASLTFGLKIVNVRCDGYYGLADLITCQWTTIQNTHCVNMVATNGRAVSARSGGSNLILENFVVDGGVGTQCYAGIYAEEFDGIFAGGGTQMNRCGNGLVIAPPTGRVFDHLFAANVSLDTCAGVGMLLRASGGQIRRLVFSAGWIGSCSNSGVQIEAGATVTGLLIDGSRIVNNGSYGLIFQAAVDSLTITDSVISGNGTSSPGTFSGMYHANAGTYTSMNISNCKIKQVEGFANTQRYAIEVQAGTGPVFTNCVITGCDMAGNLTGAAFWASSDPRTIFMRNNTGFITEAQGTATQNSATTSVVVNHGLSITPVPGEIFITPHTDINTAARFWVSNLTATQFTINTNAGPAANVTWGWQAQIA